MEQKAVPISAPKNMSRLSLSTLRCSPAEVKKLADDSRLAIARVFGRVNAIRIQEDKANGTAHTVFTGSFEGINLQSSAVQRSHKLLLPGGISEAAEKAFNALQKQSPKSTVGFAFEIRAVKANTQTGYQYEAAALIPPRIEDDLMEMRETLSEIPPLADKQRKSA